MLFVLTGGLLDVTATSQFGNTDLAELLNGTVYRSFHKNYFIHSLFVVTS
jgi:hypothetical protein